MNEIITCINCNKECDAECMFSLADRVKICSNKDCMLYGVMQAGRERMVEFENSYNSKK